MAFELPPLPFDYTALEPHIEKRTLEFHHDQHHAAYVKKLNAALENHPELQAKPLEELIGKPDALPDDVRQKVINHGGGVWNHTFFWHCMAPKSGGTPTGAVAEAMQRDFGGFDAFKEQFEGAATTLFGSGWTWLCADKGKLVIRNLPNQDSPLAIGLTPILTVDMWEHAYYLQHQNRKPEWLGAWWNTVNWEKVNERLGSA